MSGRSLPWNQVKGLPGNGTGGKTIHTLVGRAIVRAVDEKGGPFCSKPKPAQNVLKIILVVIEFPSRLNRLRAGQRPSALSGQALPIFISPD